MDLYHADIRLPQGFKLPARTVPLYWTGHARQAAANERYRVIPLWDTLDLSSCQVIEVGLTGRRVEKIVLRTTLDQNNDVVYVVIPTRDRWTIKTVWVNRQNDSHKTLDKSRYVK